MMQSSSLLKKESNSAPKALAVSTPPVAVIISWAPTAQRAFFGLAAVSPPTKARALEVGMGVNLSLSSKALRVET
jgi:hypothetical protein